MDDITLSAHLLFLQKNAVSTSHCSQRNTFEYGMALEWCALQKKSDAWWNALYEVSPQKSLLVHSSQALFLNLLS